MDYSFFAVVTFGTPTGRQSNITRDFDRACALADSFVGTGTCTNARVIRCESRRAAEAADISDTHNIVYP